MRTRPDSNVRAGRHPAAGSARCAGRFGLARLLLGIGGKVLLLAAVTSSMPACIIPVTPEWQDPEGVPNSPPEILSEMPGTDMMLSATLSAPIMFTVEVTDANVTDHLYWEFIVDHHRATSINEIAPHQDGTPLFESIPQIIGCPATLPGAPSPHPIRFFLADRPIDPVATDLMTVATPGKHTFRDWWLTIECPMASTQP